MKHKGRAAINGRQDVTLETLTAIKDNHYAEKMKVLLREKFCISLRPKYGLRTLAQVWMWTDLAACNHTKKC